MVMCAEILAIGPYRKDIAQYLEYPARTYEDTKEGTPVVRTLFGILEGSSSSREFAELLGISDVWDFNQHKLNPSSFNKDGLKDFIEIYDEHKKDLEALFAFIDLGYEFYFLPNG